MISKAEAEAELELELEAEAEAEAEAGPATAVEGFSLLADAAMELPRPRSDPLDGHDATGGSNHEQQSRS